MDSTEDKLLSTLAVLLAVSQGVKAASEGLGTGGCDPTTP